MDGASAEKCWEDITILTPYRTTLAAEARDYSPYSAIVRQHLEYSF